MLIQLMPLIFLISPLFASEQYVKPDLPKAGPETSFALYKGERLVKTENGNYTMMSIGYELPVNTQLTVQSYNPITGRRKVRLRAVPGLKPQHSPFLERSYHLEKDEFDKFVGGGDLGGSSKGSEVKNTAAGGVGQNYTLKKSVTVSDEVTLQNRNINQERSESEFIIECVKCKASALEEAAKQLQLQAVKKLVVDGNKVPKKAFKNAWKFFMEKQDAISNKKHLVVVDYNLPVDQPRLFLIDLKSGNVEKHLVAHGVNSSGDPPNEKYATKYSNSGGTHKSSYGGYITGGTYSLNYGYSMFISGAEESNSNAFERTIRVHPRVKENGLLKDTWGCFGLDTKESKAIIDKTKDGAAWYVEPYSQNV